MVNANLGELKKNDVKILEEKSTVKEKRIGNPRKHGNFLIYAYLLYSSVVDSNLYVLYHAFLVSFLVKLSWLLYVPVRIARALLLSWPVVFLNKDGQE